VARQAGEKTGWRIAVRCWPAGTARRGLENASAASFFAGAALGRRKNQVVHSGQALAGRHGAARPRKRLRRLVFCRRGAPGLRPGKYNLLGVVFNIFGAVGEVSVY
jgi:hypothetical protein